MNKKCFLLIEMIANSLQSVSPNNLKSNSDEVFEAENQFIEDFD